MENAIEDSNNMEWAELAVRLYFSGKSAKEAIQEAMEIKKMEINAKIELL